MFLIALSGSAFTRYVHSSKADTMAYYEDRYSNCQGFDVEDYNCLQDDLGYLCFEIVDGTGIPKLMLQYSFGPVCYQPLYSYYPNYPGYGD